jgi:hypothetical protein
MGYVKYYRITLMPPFLICASPLNEHSIMVVVNSTENNSSLSITIKWSTKKTGDDILYRLRFYVDLKV